MSERTLDLKKPAWGEKVVCHVKEGKKVSGRGDPGNMAIKEAERD